jgi:hypothetical protein
MWTHLVPGALFLFLGIVLLACQWLMSGIYMDAATANDSHRARRRPLAMGFAGRSLLIVGFLSANAGLTCWYLVDRPVRALATTWAVSAFLLLLFLALFGWWYRSTFGNT